MRTWYIILLFIVSLNTQAQKLITRTALIEFYSETKIENIEAKTEKASSVIDLANGTFVCQVLMQSFHFEKALMQEHFNENYVESEKYPKATFKGQFKNWKPIDLSIDSVYEFQYEGTLTMHGVSQPIKEDCNVVVKSNMLMIECRFNVIPEDYEIKIPNAVRDNISKSIEINFKAEYRPI